MSGSSSRRWWRQILGCWYVNQVIGHSVRKGKLDLVSPRLEGLPLQVFKHGWDAVSVFETVCTWYILQLFFGSSQASVIVPYDVESRLTSNTPVSIWPYRNILWLLCPHYNIWGFIGENLARCWLFLISCQCVTSRIQLTAGLHWDTLVHLESPGCVLSVCRRLWLWSKLLIHSLRCISGVGTPCPTSIPTQPEHGGLAVVLYSLLGLWLVSKWCSHWRKVVSLIWSCQEGHL